MADRDAKTKPAREKPSGTRAVAGWLNMAGSRIRNMPLHTTPQASPRDADAKQIDYNDSIRATYLTLEELAECGEALARETSVSLPGFSPFEFRARHKENEKEIFRVYRVTAKDVEAGAQITPAAEWLLDNY